MSRNSSLMNSPEKRQKSNENEDPKEINDITSSVNKKSAYRTLVESLKKSKSELLKLKQKQIQNVINKQIFKNSDAIIGDCTSHFQHKNQYFEDVQSSSTEEELTNNNNNNNFPNQQESNIDNGNNNNKIHHNDKNKVIIVNFEKTIENRSFSKLDDLSQTQLILQCENDCQTEQQHKTALTQQISQLQSEKEQGNEVKKLLFHKPYQLMRTPGKMLLSHCNETKGSGQKHPSTQKKILVSVNESQQNQKNMAFLRSVSAVKNKNKNSTNQNGNDHNNNDQKKIKQNLNHNNNEQKKIKQNFSTSDFSAKIQILSNSNANFNCNKIMQLSNRNKHSYDKTDSSRNRAMLNESLSINGKLIPNYKRVLQNCKQQLLTSVTGPSLENSLKSSLVQVNINQNQICQLKIQQNQLLGKFPSHKFQTNKWAHNHNSTVQQQFQSLQQLRSVSTTPLMQERFYQTCDSDQQLTSLTLSHGFIPSSQIEKQKKHVRASSHMAFGRGDNLANMKLHKSQIDFKNLFANSTIKLGGQLMPTQIIQYNNNDSNMQNELYYQNSKHDSNGIKIGQPLTVQEGVMKDNQKLLLNAEERLREGKIMLLLSRNRNKSFKITQQNCK